MNNTYWNNKGKYQELLNLEMVKNNELIKEAWAVYSAIFTNGVAEQAIKIFNKLLQNVDYKNIEDKEIENLFNDFVEVFEEKPSLFNYNNEEDFEEEIRLWEYNLGGIEDNITNNLDSFLDIVILFIAKQEINKL